MRAGIFLSDRIENKKRRALFAGHGGRDFCTSSSIESDTQSLPVEALGAAAVGCDRKFFVRRKSAFP